MLTRLWHQKKQKNFATGKEDKFISRLQFLNSRVLVQVFKNMKFAFEELDVELGGPYDIFVPFPKALKIYLWSSLLPTHGANWTISQITIHCKFLSYDLVCAHPYKPG